MDVHGTFFFAVSRSVIELKAVFTNGLTQPPVERRRRQPDADRPPPHADRVDGAPLVRLAPGLARGSAVAAFGVARAAWVVERSRM